MCFTTFSSLRCPLAVVYLKILGPNRHYVSMNFRNRLPGIPEVQEKLEVLRVDTV